MYFLSALSIFCPSKHALVRGDYPGARLAFFTWGVLESRSLVASSSKKIVLRRNGRI